MIELKTVYPLVDEEGNILVGLIKTLAEDEEGRRYFIRQVETGAEYSEAIDVAKMITNEFGETVAKPEFFSYEPTDIEIPVEEEEELHEEKA
jgi:hypothetical protein